jgi:aminoglycoside 6-adenylyltransferase
LSPEACLAAIRRFAEARPDIAYVIQNGSRVNPSLAPDRYADYDIIMGCRSPDEYLRDQSWIGEFGKLLILQLNEIEEDGLRWPIFLMQFEDGLRIDLQLYPGDGAAKYRSDSLSCVILDKAGALGESFEPSEDSYIVRRPDAESYRRTVNEFWWCIVNVGKALARSELTYARFMYESVVRKAFLEIVAWRVSSRLDWSVNTGKFGKFLRKYADWGLWARIESTYMTDSPEEFWLSVFEACHLVEELDAQLRSALGVDSPPENAEGIIDFLERIRKDEL